MDQPATRPKFDEIDFAMAANQICPGPDVEWFAIDRDLCVAGFTNAGFAKIPSAVFRSFQLFNAALDAISTLPRTGRAEVVRADHGDTWGIWSQHGLFAYDWDHAIGHPDPSRPYRLICYPENPIHLSVFPHEIADYIAQIHFTHLSFRETRELLVE